MSEILKFSDDEVRREDQRRHRARMRYRRATEIVREKSATTDKRMTLYQSIDACDYIVAALGISKAQFADGVLSHAGCAAYFEDWNWPPASSDPPKEPK